MTRLTLIRKYKGAIAYIFALSVLAVTACDVVCSIDRTSRLVKGHVVSADRHSHKESHHHSHKDGHHHQHGTDISDHSHSDSPASQDDNCCEDITKQFYKSLFNGFSTASVKAPIQVLVLVAVIDHYQLFDTIEYAVPLQFPRKITPDDSGVALRIRINSFLI